jgi:hypothetical protein
MLVRVGETQVEVRVEAILSAPRFGAFSNFFTWAQALMPLGIRPTIGQGAFWSQVLTRTMEQFIDKAEYILTIDMDSFFTREDIEHLFAMAMTFQCDAITGLQVKREDGRPMLTLHGTLDAPPESGATTLPASWFAEPVQEVDTAHFGLTVISTAALKRAKKPWFLESPDPSGSYGDGRRDSDIHFWANWRESGNRIFVSPRVCVGHGEYMISWPGRELTRPVYQYTTDFNSSQKRPETAWSVPS